MSETTEATPRRRGARAYFVASAVSQVAALLRYVLLARLLGPEQLGLSATLILTASFFDLISDMAADRFLIQDADGDQVAVQNLVQLALVLRGVGIAVLMALFAWPIAFFYKARELAPALAILGLSPLIAGFIHLDMRRVQRNNDFRAEGVSGMASEVAGLIGTVAAAYLTHSFTAVLFGLIARSLVLVTCSHLMANRPYGLGLSRAHVGRLGRFSAPLMVNGLILFLGGQGDRVLVGRRIGFTGLGHYSAVMLLIYYPSAIIQKYAHAIYLPLVAGARADREERAQIAARLGAQTLLLGLSMTVGFALVAPPMIGILYGRAFSLSATLVALIGILGTSRFLTLWPTTVALAMGRTGIVLANNVIRLTAWPLALVGVAYTHDLYGIVIGFILGEFIAFIVALVMLNNSEKNALTDGFDRFGMFLAVVAVTLGWTLAAAHLSIMALAALSTLSLALLAWVARAERVTIVAALASAREAVAQRR